MAVERTRQQKTPANFGPSATAMGNVDTSSANFVRQGVVDGSSAVGYKTGTAIAKSVGEFGSTAIKAAQEFRDGFQLAEHQAKVESDIEEYVRSKKNPEIADEAAVDLSTLDTMSNSLWAQLGNGTDISDIDAVEKQFQETSKKLKSALDQGVMSPDDFALRMLTNTREAVNKNPALHDEIINHTKKIMNLSGMDSLLKADQAAAQSQAKMEADRDNATQTYLIKNNIMPKYNRNGTFDRYTNEKNAELIAQEQFAADAMQRQGNIRGEQEAAQAADWMRDFGVPGINGIITNVTNTAVEMFSNVENKTDQTTAVRMMLNNTLLDLQQKAGPIAHLPGPKNALDIAEKRINSLMSTLEKFSTNADKAEFLKNEAGIMRDQDNINVMKRYSPAALELGTKLIAAVGDPKLIMSDTAVYINFKETAAGLIDMTINNPAVNYGLTLPNGKNGVSELFRSTATEANKGDESATEALTKMVSTVYADTKNDKFKSPQEKFAFYDKYISALGTEGSGKMDMEGVGKASENLEEYMNMTLSGFQADVDKLGKMGVNVHMEVIGDGRLGIVTDNPTQTEMMVKKYGIRINNGLRAFSSLSNSGTKESADSFYSAYPALKIVTQKVEEGVTGRRISKAQPNGAKVNPPNETNPFNLIIPGKAGNFQKFKSEQEGVAAASKQLQRYQSVGNPATGEKLNTVREIAGIWNNEKEAGSASARTYLNTIVNNSKLDPDAKLDLNDLDTMVSLMYGMAKAEGNPLTKKEIRLAVEGDKL